jgi:hypothetical protein
LFDGTEHLAEGWSLLAGGEEDCPFSQGVGVEEGGPWRGEPGVVCCNLAPDGEDVAAGSTALDEADASRSQGGYIRDDESRRGWRGVASAHDGGGWTHDLERCFGRFPR